MREGSFGGKATGRVCGGGVSFRMLISLTVLVCLAGCDAGILYRPTDWARTSDARYWTKTIGPAEFCIMPVGGLVGQWWTDLEMVVTNHSDAHSLSIVNAILKTKTGDYPAARWPRESFQPGARRNGAIVWEFKHGERLNHILVEPVEVSITIRVEEKQQTLVIPMTRF